MSADLREVMRDRACHVLADAIGECPDDPSAAAGEDPGACLSIADGFADLAEVYTADLDHRAELAERDLESALTERDELQEIADKLAYAIAPEEVIGEHSTGNDPWQNAIDYLDVRDAEAEKRGAVKALRMADDRLLTERDELRTVRARHDWPMGVEDAARTVRSLADRIESGEVTP